MSDAIDLAVAALMGHRAEIGKPESAFPGICMARLNPNAPWEYERWEPYHPTSDMACAWEVARKFNMLVCPTGRGTWVAATLDGSSSYGGGHFIDDTIPNYISDSISNLAEADAAEMAICLCALKASGSV